MPYSDKAILVDVNGKPIPQIWDEAGDQFVPYEGNVTLSGSSATLPVSDQHGKEYFANSLTGDIPPATETLIDDYPGRPAVIDSLEFATNHEIRVVLRLYAYKEDGTRSSVFRVVNFEGGPPTAVNAKILRDYRPDFHVLEYDTVNNVYRFIRTTPIWLPHGFAIGARNDHSSETYKGRLYYTGRFL